tara:strand:+ start:493 stop:726 length:234 start_codon:yes stop_codon:yes gene_type:complete
MMSKRPPPINEAIKITYQRGDGPLAFTGFGLDGGAGRRFAFFRPFDTGIAQTVARISSYYSVSIVEPFGYQKSSVSL